MDRHAACLRPVPRRPPGRARPDVPRAGDGGRGRSAWRAGCDARGRVRARGCAVCQHPPRRGSLGPASRNRRALARANDTETTQDNGRIVAAADYIAPELLHGARREPSSDLFSLGATLYHLVAGQAPFHRDSVMATLSAVARSCPGTADCCAGSGNRSPPGPDAHRSPRNSPP
ncbi:protein kinase domain-containing protein [Actinacidiphila soli]|uniref:protein kinase domain-containing protein n=1 Tax=Actinacidiphila soli TaxID=2487275 RepID=UPI003898F0F5